MKIERSKLKKSSSEVPADCKNLIDKLKVLEGREKVNKYNLSSLSLGLYTGPVSAGAEEHRDLDLW